MNCDGKPDIVACSEKTSLEVRWWKNEGLPVFWCKLSRNVVSRVRREVQFLVSRF
jgi:hypothetical protein